MKNYVALFFLLLSFGISAQDLVFIQFIDKPEAAYFMENPEEMLSQAALDRRINHQIELDLTDVPVAETYLNQVKNLGITLVGISKWLNGAFARCTEEQIQNIENLPGVAGVFSLVNQPEISGNSSGVDKFLIEEPQPMKLMNQTDFDDEFTNTQIEQINLKPLFEEGFTGQGIKIAVIDNGFTGVDNEEGFAYLRDHNQIKATYNFVTQNEDVYSEGNHGTRVLSTIGGYLENQFIGTAIDADFYLFVSENNQYEMPDEEVNWIMAAEKADSLGVDIINTSLGYTTFDDPRYDYQYEDMDGQTTYISRAAQIAADKGIITVVSAGNEGQKNWHYISAPSDAVRVLSVGAAMTDSLPAGFSSYGPTSDQRMKPDISALGVGAAVFYNNSINTSNGTSFSSPIIAGAMACLVQAFPQKSPFDLIEKIKATGHLYHQPDNQLGYGIPNFGFAYEELLSVKQPDFEPEWMIYPNPTDGLLKIQSSTMIKQLQIISFEGKILRKYNTVDELNLEEFPSGIYLLKIQFENGQTGIRRVIKN